MAFAPDGRLFVSEQAGTMQVAHTDGTFQKTPEGTKVPSSTSVASIPGDADDTDANRSTHRSRSTTGPLGARAPGSLPSSGLCSVVSLPYERIYKHGAAARARTSGTHRWIYGLERRGRGGEPRGEHCRRAVGGQAVWGLRRRGILRLPDHAAPDQARRRRHPHDRVAGERALGHGSARGRSGRQWSDLALGPRAELQVADVLAGGGGPRPRARREARHHARRPARRRAGPAPRLGRSQPPKP